MCPHRVLGRQSQQQISVLAHYEDGKVRDVTRQAQYQSNEIAVAAVDEDGLVRTVDLAGEATIMARYQGQVAVFRATVPLDKPIAKYPDFPQNNYIDKLTLAKWKKLGLVPSDLCSDGEFIRRVSLDLCGKLPTPDEVRAFLADTKADKRAKLIDKLLDDKEYAAHFAMRRKHIRNSRLAEGGGLRLPRMDRDMVARNRPYDQFARRGGAAGGGGKHLPSTGTGGCATIKRSPSPIPPNLLGLRSSAPNVTITHMSLEPGRLRGWLASSRGCRKSCCEPPPYYSARTGTSGGKDPPTGKPIEPKLLDGPVLEVSAKDDPRHKLVDWMAKQENPFFAKALANRMWGHFLGRGLVDPVDDMRETNPPSNPELLDALAKDFVEHKFDVKHLIRTICNSRTYQLSSEPNEYNKHDRQNHARFYGKRMIAEVMLDAVDQVCGSRTQFSKMSKQARAVDLPHEGFGSYFLDVFDRPPRSSPCECARSNGASLSQVLHLTNSPEIEDKIGSEQGRVAKMMKDKVAVEKAIDDIYLAAFARLPSADEKQKGLEYVAKQKEPRRGLEDLVWALLNTREFMFIH